MWETPGMKDGVGGCRFPEKEGNGRAVHMELAGMEGFKESLA